MEEFKVDDYEREFGKGSFPAFKQAEPAALEAIRQALTRSFGIDPASSGVQLAYEICNRGQPVEGVSPEEEDFDLRALATRLGLQLSGSLYLNWHHFERVDEMCAEDVVRCFYDIWYPVADDLDIFDASMTWMLTITHFGAILVNRMGG